MRGTHRLPVIQALVPWIISLSVHGGIAVALLNYHPQTASTPSIQVMELVQLPEIVTAPPPAPEPPAPPVVPPPKPVAKPKPAEPPPEVTEYTEPAREPEPAAPAPPAPPPIARAVEPAAVVDEPEPVFNLDAAYLENPQPSYPEVARRRGWQGTVVLQLMLDEQGLPHSLQVHQSSGFEVLDRAALSSVREWRFRPAQVNGIAVALNNVRVPIQFRLIDR